LGGVVEGDFAAGALLGGVDDAGVEGARIYVEADGALVESARVEDAVNGSERVDGAGVLDIHFDSFRGFDAARAGDEILVDDGEIFYLQASDGDGHPAVLVFVVVDGADLADFPADGQEFIERSFVDQIAGVVLAVPGEVGSEGVGVYGRVLKKGAQLLGFGEGALGELAELGYEVLDGDGFYGGGHGLSEYSAGIQAVKNL
jgi:hypothetical protein